MNRIQENKTTQLMTLCDKLLFTILLWNFDELYPL